MSHAVGKSATPPCRFATEISNMVGGTGIAHGQHNGTFDIPREFEREAWWTSTKNDKKIQKDNNEHSMK